MKVEILRDNLRGGLSVAEKAVGKTISLPILSNVVLRAEDTYVNLISTDLETSLKVWVMGKIVEKGEVVVPAKFLTSFVGTLPNDKITLESKNQDLHIACKSVKTQIQGYNPEDFPIIPDFTHADRVELDIKKLHEALSQVADVAMPSQTRPEISGILFSFANKEATVVATDSFRLAEKTLTLSSPIKTPHTFILPQKPARDIMNVLDGREGTITIFITPNQLLFELAMPEAKHPAIQLTSRLIEGEYPNYQDIIPNSFITTAILQKEELISQLKTASLFSGKTNEVRVAVDPQLKQIALSAKSADVGEHHSNVAAKVAGEPMEVSFNYKFLMDGLQNIRGSEVSFEISRQDGPCVLRPVGDASYLYVVMPIKSL